MLAAESSSSFLEGQTLWQEGGPGMDPSLCLPLSAAVAATPSPPPGQARLAAPSGTPASHPPSLPSLCLPCRGLSDTWVWSYPPWSSCKLTLSSSLLALLVAGADHVSCGGGPGGEGVGLEGWGQGAAAVYLSPSEPLCWRGALRLLGSRWE